MDVSTAWINGRTLDSVLGSSKASHEFGKFSLTDRVPVRLSRDKQILGIGKRHGVPFVVEGNLFATIHDFDFRGTNARFNASESIVSVANVRISRRALASGASEFVRKSPQNKTRRIELFAKQMNSKDRKQAFKFSRDVCEWGRGERVWANLSSFHSSDALGRSVSNWLEAAKRFDEPAQALAPGTEIKGLGVSFASKHLRLLDPVRFGALDAVISEGLGYALNGAGYNLWMRDLREIKRRHGLSLRVGDIESGVFVLIRQVVRGVVGREPGQ